MPIHWKPFLAPSTLALKFAIKTLLAGGLALWCAFASTWSSRNGR
ncbi:hypothetical protein P4056_05800 [Pseudomonas aeruginosa]|nr:hypothetical protein [Pseudomonas aeruginosa]